jgi:hypothetical protein
MKSAFTLGVGVLLFSLVARATTGPSATPVPATSSDRFRIGGVESQYTDRLTKQLASWPPKDINYAVQDENPVHMACIETPGERYYIGLEQSMFVNTPLEKVTAVLDDIAHYQELFPDFDDVHEVSREGNRIVTFWEQHIPVFFVPNVKYEVIYLVDSSHPDRKVYRYQLKKKDHIKNNDGMIVVERAGASRTRYTEYDFFDADWGPLTTFAPGRIWKDSVEGIYRSDVAIKLKAENPSWSYDKIRDEGKKALERFPVDELLKKRKVFNP